MKLENLKCHCGILLHCVIYIKYLLIIFWAGHYILIFLKNKYVSFI